jgi:hypothetical protein
VNTYLPAFLGDSDKAKKLRRIRINDECELDDLEEIVKDIKCSIDSARTCDSQTRAIVQQCATPAYACILWHIREYMDQLEAVLDLIVETAEVAAARYPLDRVMQVHDSLQRSAIDLLATLLMREDQEEDHDDEMDR